MQGVQIGILVLLFVIAALLGVFVFQQSFENKVETAADEPIPEDEPAAELFSAAQAPKPPKPRTVRRPRKLAPTAAAVPQAASKPKPESAETWTSLFPVISAGQAASKPKPESAETASEQAARPPRTPVKTLKPEPFPASPSPREVTLPAGYRLAVRLVDAISTDYHSVGDAFTAYLDEPLVVNGLTIAEKYARVDGRVVESRRGGRIKGRAGMWLELVRLHAKDGQQVNISTAPLGREAKSSIKQDARKIGILTGIGAAVGAVAGGRKGSAIGAGVGAGTGGGTVAATRGAALVVPAETRLVFSLASMVDFIEQP